MYTDIVDITGHWYGPDSPQLEAALRSVDQSLGRLLLEWDNARVQNKTVRGRYRERGLVVREGERLAL